MWIKYRAILNIPTEWEYTEIETLPESSDDLLYLFDYFTCERLRGIEWEVITIPPRLWLITQLAYIRRKRNALEKLELQYSILIYSQE